MAKQYQTFEDIQRARIIKEYVIITLLTSIGIGGLVSVQVMLHYQ